MNLSQPTHPQPGTEPATTTATGETSGMFRLNTVSVLRFDAAVSFGSGLVAALAAGPLSRTLDLSSTSVLRGIGIVLMIYGLALALGSTRSDAALRETLLVTGVTDLTWVGASLVVAAVVELPAWGVAVALIQAVAVLGIGLTKFQVLRR